MQGTEQKNRFGEYVKDFEDKFRKALTDVDKVARETVHNLVPAETASHLSNCKREFLLAVRSMIDRELDNSQKPPAPPTSTETEADITKKAAE
jgi:hypothetical protein